MYFDSSQEKNGADLESNGHLPEPMETEEKPVSRVTVRSGLAKRPREKGAIMEQDIDGLEYSSEEENSKPTEDFDEIFSMANKKSKAVSHRSSMIFSFYLIV